MFQDLLERLINLVRPSMTPEEMTKALDEHVAKGPPLDWRHSIVDLLKALDMDSSPQAREKLAKELGYTGDLEGSSDRNMWLHKAVMAKVANRGIRIAA